MILVTGGLGFIGVHTARALLDLDETCVITQHRTTRKPELLMADLGSRALVEAVDVMDLDSLAGVGRRHRITGIVHLAGAAMAALDPVAEVRLNLTGLLNVIQAGRDWEVDRITVASTIGVYGLRSGPLREDTPLPPLGVHAIQACKTTFEVLDTFLSGAVGIEIVNARPSAIWGPLGRTESPFFGAPQLVHAAVRGGAADHVPSRHVHYAQDSIDMCYVKDCGRAIALLQTARALNHPTYNVGSGRATTNADVAAAVRAVIPEARVDLPAGHNPDRPATSSWMDITRLREDTGFEPAYDVERGLADYVQWLRAGHAR
jgi:UDP-glucose 4-epimerase